MNEFEKYLENNGYKKAGLSTNEWKKWRKETSCGLCLLDIFIVDIQNGKYEIEISLFETYHIAFILELFAFDEKTFTNILNQRVNKIKSIAIEDINNTNLKDNE